MRPIFNADKIDMFKMNKVLGQCVSSMCIFLTCSYHIWTTILLLPLTQTSPRNGVVTNPSCRSVDSIICLYSYCFPVPVSVPCPTGLSFSLQFLRQTIKTISSPYHIAHHLTASIILCHFLSLKLFNYVYLPLLLVRLFIFYILLCGFSWRRIEL